MFKLDFYTYGIPNGFVSVWYCHDNYSEDFEKNTDAGQQKPTSDKMVIYLFNGDDSNTPAYLLIAMNQGVLFFKMEAVWERKRGTVILTDRE